ncbi:CLUMA_CG001972, isoform A [Clunio marinus]|uniref:CLUMA_CG001972, isoform A n=1 Tax=Clunio marinus TaxID=568069 RepID=A0A1J1HJH9_9DIPT|nr:CLUMA_CG001972, isoform A [Clunio marinus]
MSIGSNKVKSLELFLCLHPFALRHVVFLLFLSSSLFLQLHKHGSSIMKSYQQAVEVSDTKIENRSTSA